MLALKEFKTRSEKPSERYSKMGVTRVVRPAPRVGPSVRADHCPRGR